MAYFSFDNEDFVRMLDELAVKVPKKVPEALEKMSDYLKPKLISAAPYDTKNHPEEQKHLREVIKRTNVRVNNAGNSRYVTIFVSPRGVSEKSGKRAKENWNADKHVFKLVVAEYGSSKVPPRPFWKQTVNACEDKVIDIGKEIILSEVDKCGK